MVQTPDIILKLQKIGAYNLAFFCILIVAALVRCYEITLPYCKPWEIAFQEIIAKNHYYFGFWKTHFLSVVSVVDGQNVYHLNHQPLLQILIALSYHLFGVHEWSARLVPILFSLGTIMVLYLIANRVYNKRIAVITALFAAFMPMSAYYGRLVNFEPVVLFFVVLFVYAYYLWVETERWAFYCLAIVAILLGGLTDWPFFVILPIILCISLYTGKKVRSTSLLFLLGCSLAAGFLLLKHCLLGYQKGVSGWFAHLGHRSNVSSFIFNGELYSLLVERFWENFTIIPILTIFGIGLTARGFDWHVFKARKVPVRALIAPALLLFGLSYAVVFLESTFVHVWQLYYLIPGCSLFAAVAIEALCGLEVKKPYAAAIPKCIAVLLIVAFLALSAQHLASVHQSTSYEPYQFGHMIEECTDPGDYVCIPNLFTPIAYYSNRSYLQNPIEGPDLSLIFKYHPKVVVFPHEENIDSDWDRGGLIEALEAEHYHHVLTGPQFQFWMRDGDIPHLALRQMRSVTLYNHEGTEKIRELEHSDLVAPSYNVNNTIGLFEHPTGEGLISVSYDVSIPDNAALHFSIGLDERTWSPEKGDGVEFSVYVNSSGQRSLLFSRYIDPKNNPEDRRWHEFSVPLDDYGGENTTISFATSPGPNRNNAYDWAFWIDPRIVAKG